MNELGRTIIIGVNALCEDAVGGVNVDMNEFEMKVADCLSSFEDVNDFGKYVAVDENDVVGNVVDGANYSGGSFAGRVTDFSGSGVDRVND